MYVGGVIEVIEQEPIAVVVVEARDDEPALDAGARIVAQRKAVVGLHEDEPARDVRAREQVGLEHRASPVTLRELDVPEHGVQGEAGEHHPDEREGAAHRASAAGEPRDGQREQHVLDGQDVGKEPRATPGVVAVEVEARVREHVPETSTSAATTAGLRFVSPRSRARGTRSSSASGSKFATSRRCKRSRRNVVPAASVSPYPFGSRASTKSPCS